MAAIGGFPGQDNSHELSVYLGATKPTEDEVRPEPDFPQWAYDEAAREHEDRDSGYIDEV